VTLHVYTCPQCPGTVSLSILGVVPWCQGAAHGGRPVVMLVVPDQAKALLPIDPEAGTLARLGGYGGAELAPLKVEHLKAAGILLPETQDALEWLYRRRKENGMAQAFTKIGGRRYIDLVAFARLVRTSK
jgi:hypothetical protein